MSRKLSCWKILAFENFAKSCNASQEINMSDVKSSQSRSEMWPQDPSVKTARLSDISGSHIRAVTWGTPWNLLGKYFARPTKEQKKEDGRAHVDQVKVKLALASRTSSFAFITWPILVSFFLSFFPYRRAEMVSRHFYNFFFAKYLFNILTGLLCKRLFNACAYNIWKRFLKKFSGKENMWEYFVL